MTKYSKEIRDEVAGYIRDGMTFRESCLKAGISEDSFARWRKDKADFAEAIKSAIKEKNEIAYEDAQANSSKIVGSLIDLATGKAKRVTTTTKYAPDPHGKPIIIEKTTKEETIQANVGAAIFILTNTDGERWKNRQDIKQDLSGKIEGLNIIVKDEEEAELIKQIKKK